MKLLDLISTDKEHPSTRASLVAASGRTDRSVRQGIEDLRRKGHWIVSLKTGGYYLTKDPDEWRAFVERERKRALATFKRSTILETAQTAMKEAQ